VDAQTRAKTAINDLLRDWANWLKIICE
jgi:hypothetical protein